MAVVVLSRLESGPLSGGSLVTVGEASDSTAG